MPLPGDLTTCTVTGTYLDAAGSPQQGRITFTPSADLTDATGEVVVPMSPRAYSLSRGEFTSDPLCATDNTTISPSGWTYSVVLYIAGLPPQAWSISLPHSGSPVDISTITPAVTQVPTTSALLSTGGSVSGTLTLNASPPLRIPAGASSGDVLTSDSSGNASWGPITAAELPAATSGAIGGVELGTDLGGTATAPHVVATHLGSPLPLAQGGTAGATQQAAINALTGSQGAGTYLRSNGTNASLSALQAADVPTLNQNTSGTAAGLSSTLAVGSGGTGATTGTGALTALGGDSRYGQLATASTYTADQYFKSGRPWFDVIAFGADPTGTADSTPAFNAAILAATGSANPATTGRTAKGPVFMPAGTYKITSDLLIQSVLGFRLIGAAHTSTAISASGTGFTTAVVNIDGSLDGYFAGFEVIGDGTEAAGASSLPAGINLTWTSAAYRSTSANTFEHIRIRNLKFVSGLVQAAPASTGNQVDGSTLIDVQAAGGQTIGSWSSSGLYQYGFVFGNGTYANQYDYALYNCGATLCYYGYYCNASGFTLHGGQPAGNYCDFNINGAAAEVSVTGLQSQSAQMFLKATGGSSSQAMAFRDVIWKGYPSSAPPSNWWISIVGGGSAWEFSNIACGIPTSAYTPVVNLNSGGATVIATFINFQQANTPSSGFHLSGSSRLTAVAVNYVQLNTDGATVSTAYPLYVLGGAIQLNGGLAGATAASRWAGATASGAPATGTFLAGDFVIDQSGSLWVCSSGGSPGTWVQLSAQQNPSAQWVTATGSYTWTKPAGAQTVDVFLLSSGAGGGGGAVAIAANAGAGGGGAGGSLFYRTFLASDLPSSVTGSVGAGGSGGAAVSGTTAANGNAGSGGNVTSFGSECLAIAGNAGGAGTTSVGGSGGAAQIGTNAGGPGSAGSTSANAFGTANAAGASGGAGGGGANTGAAYNGGGAGYSEQGTSANTGSGGVAGGATPGSGTQPAIKGTPSCGGGGGAGVNTAGSTAQSGATPFYGGGGGGGGGAFYPGSGSAVTSGAGGTGGPGFVLIITHFA